MIALDGPLSGATPWDEEIARLGKEVGRTARLFREDAQKKARAYRQGVTATEARYKRLVEALQAICNGMSFMREWCIKHKVHKGMADDNTASLMFRVASAALADIERGIREQEQVS